MLVMSCPMVHVTMETECETRVIFGLFNKTKRDRGVTHTKVQCYYSDNCLLKGSPTYSYHSEVVILVQQVAHHAKTFPSVGI